MCSGQCVATSGAMLVWSEQLAFCFSLRTSWHCVGTLQTDYLRLGQHCVIEVTHSAPLASSASTFRRDRAKDVLLL